MILATLGTGIGTALIYDGVLVPNTELGHMEVDGMTPRSARHTRRRSANR